MAESGSRNARIICPSLGQIILPKRLAVRRRVGWIGIQLAKRTGDSFQASLHSGRIS